MCIINFIGFKRVGKWIFNIISFRWLLWLIIWIRFRTPETNPAASLYDGVVGAHQKAKDALEGDNAGGKWGLDDDDDLEAGEDPFKKKTKKIEEFEMAEKLRK